MVEGIAEWEDDNENEPYIDAYDPPAEEEKADGKS